MSPARLSAAPSFVWHQAECGEIVISFQASCYWLKPAVTGTSSVLPISPPLHETHQPNNPPLFSPSLFLFHTPFSHISCTSGHLVFQPLPSSTPSLFNPSNLTSSLSFSLHHPPLALSFLPLLLCPCQRAPGLYSIAPRMQIWLNLKWKHMTEYVSMNISYVRKHTQRSCKATRWTMPVFADDFLWGMASLLSTFCQNTLC